MFWESVIGWRDPRPLCQKNDSLYGNINGDQGRELQYKNAALPIVTVRSFTAAGTSKRTSDRSSWSTEHRTMYLVWVEPVQKWGRTSTLFFRAPAPAKPDGTKLRNHSGRFSLDRQVLIWQPAKGKWVAVCVPVGAFFFFAFLISFFFLASFLWFSFCTFVFITRFLLRFCDCCFIFISFFTMRIGRIGWQRRRATSPTATRVTWTSWGWFKTSETRGMRRES